MLYHIDTIAKLRQGRERIARGWCQLDLARDADGSPVEADGPYAVAWCAYGASFSYYSDVALEVAVRKIAGDDANPAKWNDQPERTQADVLALYDRAIELVEKGEV